MKNIHQTANTSLGVGIAFRQDIEEKILEYADQIDFLEVIPEQYFFNRQMLQDLSRLTKQFIIIPHGINLSIGSPVLNRKHLDKIEEVCSLLECPYYSDHLGLRRFPGVELGHFCPILFTEESLKIVVRNVQIIQRQLGIPLVLENIVYEFKQPSQTMTEEEFFQKLFEETGCGILLDVTNVHTNAYNFSEDKYAFIDHLPSEAVKQFHIAGGYYSDEDKLVDAHNQPVEIESWELLEYCVKEKGIKKGVILEHEDNFPEDFTDLLKQLEIAKRILTGQEWRSELKNIHTNSVGTSTE